MGAAQNLRPWKPGQSGNPGGKPKNQVFPRVAELLKAQGKEPIAELLALIPTLAPRIQAQVWLEILPYVHGKVKPLEDVEPDELSQLPTEELEKMVKEKLREVG